MSNAIPARNIQLKRAYDKPTRADGARILIDRLWPRGVSKQDAALDHWMKEIAPSTALRKWFDHDPERWHEFQRRYEIELREHPEQIRELRAIARKGTLTLVYSAHDEAHNDAVALRKRLLGRKPGR